MSLSNELINYEKACLQLATNFINNWHIHNKDVGSIETEEEVLARFICRDPTDVFEFADMYIDIDYIVEFYRTGATYEQFEQWYWDKIEEKTQQNLKHYLISKKIENGEMKAPF